MDETALRERMVLQGASLFNRGYTAGTSGNMSARLQDGMLLTPTNACMGRLDQARISKLDWEGHHLSGDPPSKEAPLHLAVYRKRPADAAVVHLHSVHAVAVSCLKGLNPEDLLPPITPYYVMRIGRLPLVPYHPPGDPALAEAVGRFAEAHHAMMLANHGPVVAAKDLDTAVYAAEELEETAKLFLLLHRKTFRGLKPEDVARLKGQASR